MKREQAIYILNNMRNYYANRQGGEQNTEALDVAILSLKIDEMCQLAFENKGIPKGENT